MYFCRKFKTNFDMKTTKQFMMVCCLMVMMATTYGQDGLWDADWDFSAECETGQTLYYKISDSINSEVTMTHPALYNGVLETWDGYEKPTGEIIFPSEVVYDGIFYSVTRIEDGAFMNCQNLTGDLIIPNSVISIGYRAFDNCRRFSGNLLIPNSVEVIEGQAFNGLTNITGEINIPNSVVAIGELAFASFWKITAFRIPESVTYLGHGFIWACSKLVTLEVNENNPVYYSESNAIIERETKKLIQATKTTVIPEDITIIGERAFLAVENQGNLVIPQSVVSIEDEAFKYALFTGALTLPENLRHIGKYAFYTTYFTGNLYVPDGVSTIGDHAFARTRFTEVHLPEALKILEWDLFWDCGRLEQLEIGSQVDTIQSGVFQYCDRLNCMKIHCEVPPTALYNAFSGVNKDIPVHIPVGTLADYQSAPYWNEFTNFIEDGLMSVGEEETSLVQVTCYPNPAKEKVIIDGIEPAEVQVYNALGQLVKTARGTNEVDVRELPEGVYLLHIMDNQGVSQNFTLRTLVKSPRF